jgi:phthiocerol/phenolphthiocerol synthesis type-I polyketide synthase E
MDPVLTPFAEYLSTVTLHAPRIPMLSNVTGTWMTDEEATDPNRWAQHIRSTVRFADEFRHCSAIHTGCSWRWGPAAV